LAIVRYDRDSNLLHFNIPNPFRRQSIPAVTKDPNWFVRFLQIAKQEDGRANSGVTDPYRQIAWANIAVTKLASNCARSDFQLYRGDTMLESGPVWKLFRDVNPILSRYQLWEATVSWLFSRGECFWLYPLPNAGVPEAFYLPDPSQMKESVDRDGNITLWTRELENDKIPYLPTELVHFRLWNPWNRIRGVNPLIALDYDLGMDYQATRANFSMLLNGAVPSGLLKTDNPTMSTEQAQEIKTRWNESHRGSNKRGEIAVLGAGTSYQSIQLSPQDMEYFNTKKWTREAIMAKYGVPLVLSGANQESSPLSGTDTRYQMRNFWEGTLIPILRFIEDKLETDFFGRHKLDLTGTFNTDDIPELQQDENERSARDLADISSGVRTINEVRDEQGLDPVPWGDVWWAPLALSPVSGSTDPNPPALPAKAMAFFDVTPKAIEAPVENKGIPYTEEFKSAHWKSVDRVWSRVEAPYKKELQTWIFGIRSHVLGILAAQKAPTVGVVDEIMDSQYWAQADAELRRMTMKNYRVAVLAAQPAVMSLLESIGAPIVSPSWSIWNTDAVEMLEVRLGKISRVTETIREDIELTLKDAISGGLTDGETADIMVQRFNIAQNRANVIARTEIGGAINDAEIATYIDQGFTEIMWLTTRDGKARDTHWDEDTHVRKIGEAFDNGLIYPHDPDGSAEEVINCRCLSIPEKESRE
jgi:HK97 family phage portal protein